MQFPESWLREFCNPPITTAELADLLTMAGLEVEDTRPVAPPCRGVVVAEIVEAVQHPNADRLRVCKVLAGAHSPDGPLQIVCGAPNARVGIRVPLALVGAELPPAEEGASPFAIKVGKLRGVDSFGMLCSARELKLSDDHGGLLELPADAPVGQDIRELLALDDTVFTLKLTPNLAHALSVYGVAREVSALTGAPLLTPLIEAIPPQHDQKLPVQVDAPDLCGRFSGRVVRNVNTKAKTPDWMVAAAGALRPALGDGAGGHLQLRDVRVRPADAHLRPGQDPRQAGGALGPHGRKPEAAQRQHHRARRFGGRDRRCAGGGIAGRHHGRRCHRGVGRHAPRVRGSGLLVAAGRGRALAALQLRHRRRAPLRARRRPGADGRAHRARDAADPGHLRRRTRPAGRPDAQPAATAAGDAARGAGRQGHRHAADASSAAPRSSTAWASPSPKARARSP